MRNTEIVIKADASVVRSYDEYYNKLRFADVGHWPLDLPISAF